MRLEQDYYETMVARLNGPTGMFVVRLKSNCDVYQGHFPGQPICPGVYNIQLVRECAERLTRRSLRIHSIQRCRLIALLTPIPDRELIVCIQLAPLDEGYACQATISDVQQTYVEFKGKLVK